MPPERQSSDGRSAARVAHAMASVAPIHVAFGMAPDPAHGAAVAEFYDHRPAWAIPGSVTVPDALFLAEMVRATRPRVIIEIGVAAGCSTAMLAWAGAAHGARVIALDALDRWFIDPSRPVACAAEPMLADHPDARAAISLRTGCTALDAASHAEPWTVDLAFIDADHRHPWPILDALAILDLMRDDAWVIAHDTRLVEMAARHERKSGAAAPWTHRGPARLVSVWPGRTIHAATETGNIAAMRVCADRAGLRAALVDAIDAFPWEIDASDPAVRRTIDRLRPRTPARARGRRIVPEGGALRIALVSREFPPAFGGGIGTAMAHNAAALVGGGHTVHVVCAGTGSSASVEHLVDGLVVHRIPVAGAGLDWWASRMDFAARCASVVDGLSRAGAIDIAEFPECEAPAIIHTLAQARPGPIVPTVVQLHTPTEVLSTLGSAAYDAPCDGLWAAIGAERACVGLADAVYAPSRFIADWARGWWGLDALPAVVPYAHAPTLDPIVPRDRRAGRTVLYLGRIEPRKGVGVLGEAWSRVAACCPDARLVLAGADTSHATAGGSVRRAMERGMTPAALERAIFTGPVSPGRIAELIDRCDLCVVPSLWENFPNVAIEAMARGRPVVVSDQGGMAEMIGGSAGGTVFRSGVASSLAGALEAMIRESDAALDARGFAARGAIAEVCDPVSTTPARVAVYRHAIARALTRGAREQWIDLAHRCLDATAGDGPPIEARPLPSFGPDITRWVGPRRTFPTIDAA